MRACFDFLGQKLGGRGGGWIPGSFLPMLRPDCLAFFVFLVSIVLTSLFSLFKATRAFIVSYTELHVNGRNNS